MAHILDGLVPGEGASLLLPRDVELPVSESYPGPDPGLRRSGSGVRGVALRANDFPPAASSIQWTESTKEALQVVSWFLPSLAVPIPRYAFGLVIGGNGEKREQ